MKKIISYLCVGLSLATCMTAVANHNDTSLQAQALITCHVINGTPSDCTNVLKDQPNTFTLSWNGISYVDYNPNIYYEFKLKELRFDQPEHRLVAEYLMIHPNQHIDAAEKILFQTNSLIPVPKTQDDHSQWHIIYGSGFCNVNQGKTSYCPMKSDT